MIGRPNSPPVGKKSQGTARCAEGPEPNLNWSVLGGWRTLSRFFLLTNARSSMIPLQYVNAEELV
jgi:hypothetical protein